MSEDPGNPMEKARAGARPPLPRRFYTEVGVVPSANGCTIHLDGRPVRTPNRQILEVSSRVVADALAAEWRAQVATIDPGTMPLTRLVNTAIEGIARREAAVRADVVKYAGTDLLCYRAEHPATLVARQQAAWDPLLAWASEALGIGFKNACGIVHVPQSEAALARVAGLIEPLPALTLAALHSATTLTGSAVLALAVLHGRLTAPEAWRLAHVDEDFQIEQWGWDAEAKAARDRRWSELQAAALVLTAANALP